MLQMCVCVCVCVDGCVPSQEQKHIQYELFHYRILTLFWSINES